MSDGSVKTCFHLDWPKEACDTLRRAVNFTINCFSLESQEFKAFGPEVQKSIKRILNNFDLTGMGLGIEILNHPVNGVIVRDVGGVFSPSMTADLLKAIMMDHGIDGAASFSWSENGDIHRLDAFAGGGVVVSAREVVALNIRDWIWMIKEKINQIDENITESPPAP